MSATARRPPGWLLPSFRGKRARGRGRRAVRRPPVPPEAVPRDPSRLLGVEPERSSRRPSRHRPVRGRCPQTPGSLSNAAGVSAKQQLALRLVEDPDEVRVCRHEATSAAGSTSAGAASRTARAPARSPSREERHGLRTRSRLEVGGREGEAPVECLAGLGVTPQYEQRRAEPFLDRDISRIEALGLLQMFDRRIPAAEARLDDRRSPRRGACVAGREASCPGVLLQSAVEVVATSSLVVCRARGTPPGDSGPARWPSPPPAGCAPPARRWEGLELYRNALARDDSRPGQREVRIERHGLL